MRRNLYLTIFLIICFLSSCNTQKSCLNLNLGINVDLEIERCERKLEALNYLEDNSLESYQKLIKRLNSGKGYSIESIVEAYNLDTIINNLHRCPFSDTSFLNEYRSYLDTAKEVSFESSSYIIENELKRNLFQGKIIFAIFLKHSLDKEDAITRMLVTEMNVKQNTKNEVINSPPQLIQILVNKNREFIVDDIKMKPNDIHQYLDKKIQFIELDSSSVFEHIKQTDSNYINILSNVKWQNTNVSIPKKLVQIEVINQKETIYGDYILAQDKIQIFQDSLMNQLSKSLFNLDYNSLKIKLVQNDEDAVIKYKILRHLIPINIVEKED